MTGARWRPGASHETGAALFGVTVGTLVHDAAEASRLLRLLMLADEDLKDLCVAALHRAIEMAENSGGASGARAIAECVSVMAGLKGLDAPKELKLSGSVTLDDLEEIKKASGENK
jgi:hypothetical protein